MRKILIFLCVFCLNFAFAKAQSLQDLIPKIEERPREITDTLNRDYDNRIIEVPDLDENLREQYNSNDFNYKDDSNEGGNFVSRIINGFFNWLGDTFGVEVSPFWSIFLKVLIYIVMAAVGIYFLVRLLAKESPQSLLGKNKRVVATVNMEETHIEEIDLAQLINENIASGNYRNAIRYLYLDSLKNLSSTDKIEWDFQKTNSDYYRELKDPILKKLFKKVSYLYDYVWYGEFDLNETSFNDARSHFESLKNQTL